MYCLQARPRPPRRPRPRRPRPPGRARRPRHLRQAAGGPLRRPCRQAASWGRLRLLPLRALAQTPAPSPAPRCGPSSGTGAPPMAANHAQHARHARSKRQHSSRLKPWSQVLRQPCTACAARTLEAPAWLPLIAMEPSAPPAYSSLHSLFELPERRLPDSRVGGTFWEAHPPCYSALKLAEVEALFQAMQRKAAAGERLRTALMGCRAGVLCSWECGLLVGLAGSSGGRCLLGCCLPALCPGASSLGARSRHCHRRRCRCCRRVGRRPQARCRAPQAAGGAGPEASHRHWHPHGQAARALAADARRRGCARPRRIHLCRGCRGEFGAGGALAI